MKKTILLTLFFTLLPTLGLWSQTSVNVDNQRFAYYERQLPKKNFNPRFFYYTSQFTLPHSVNVFINEDELADQIRISGQRKSADQENANMLVNVIMEPLEIIDSKLERRTEEKKNSSGDTIRTRFYWLEISYSFVANAKIVDQRTNRVMTQYEVQNRKTTRVFKSREYESRKAAELYWTNNQDVLREEFTRQEALSAVQRLNSMIEKDYSCLITKTYSLIKTINEKKHPEHTPLRRMSNSLETKFRSLDGNRPLTIDDVKDELNYFMKIPQRYTSKTSKADIRLRYVAYYNICRIYLFIEQPQKVQKWADLLYENGHDKKDRLRLTEDAANLQRVLVTGIGTQHFDPQNYFQN